MTVKVTSYAKQFLSQVDRSAARAVTKASVIVASHASVYTPIDTSTLLNSQYRKVTRDGTKVIGEIGYTAGYALPVHDPMNKQNFRRATARKEFLKKGGDESESMVLAAIKAEMKA